MSNAKRLHYSYDEYRAWDETELRSGEHVTVHDPAFAFAVDEIYDGVTLDPK